MPQISVFDGIVSDEDDYSKLLCNLLNRSERFRIAFLALVPRAASHGDYEAKLHREHKEGGIPDITLCFADGTKYFVEVKANRSCPPTFYQRGAYGEPNCLTFLVPIGYRHEIPTGAERRFWNEVSSIIRNSDELNYNPLIQEFQMLIERKFAPIQLDPDEAKRLGTYDKKDLASLVVTLPHAVDALQQHFDSARVSGQKLNADFDSYDDEYGFVIRSGNQRLLWVGVWRSEGLLFAAAYDAAWGLRAPLPEFVDCRSNQGWKVFNLDRAILSGADDMVSGAINELEAIVKRIIAAQNA